MSALVAAVATAAVKATAAVGVSTATGLHTLGLHKVCIAARPQTLGFPNCLF